MSLIEMDGAITPVTVRLLAAAGAWSARRPIAPRRSIVQLDTPGGLERSMRSIVQIILDSDVPVIVYVGPTGARPPPPACSSPWPRHVAAMAPATNIGAAHPVAVGGQMDKDDGKKVENDAAAFVRTIATERGRNVEWAEKAVRARCRPPSARR